MKTRYIEAVASSRHGHVKEPPQFAVLFIFEAILDVRDGWQPRCSLDCPDRKWGVSAGALNEINRDGGSTAIATCVGEDDDVGFEAFPP